MLRIITTKSLRWYEQKADEAMNVPGLEARCATLQQDWDEAVAYIQVLETQHRAARDQVTDLNRQLRELTTTVQELRAQSGLPQADTANTAPVPQQMPQWAWAIYRYGHFAGSGISEDDAKARAIRYGAPADIDFDTNPNHRIIRMDWNYFMHAQPSEVLDLQAALSRHDATTH